MQPDTVVSGIPFAAIAMIVWIAAVMLCIGLGFILSYHWYRYTLHKSTANLALTVYIAVSGFILFALFAAAMALPL